MKLVRQLACSAALLVAGIASAQIIRIPVNPPVVVSPAAGTSTTYNYVTPAQAFVWEQYPAYATPGNAVPTHFLLCFRRPAEPACSHGNADFNLLPGSVPSTGIRVGLSPFPVGYRYTFVPVLPDDALDETVEWTVGACVNGTDASCMFTPARRLLLMTRDIVAVEGGYDTVMGIKGKLANRGTRVAEAFQMQLDAWDVFMTPDEKCKKDPNEFLGRSHMYALMKNGAVVPFDHLAAGPGGMGKSSEGIEGIYQANSTLQWRGGDIPVSAVRPTTTGGTSISLFPPVFPGPGARPLAMVVRVWGDSNNVLVEPDERNAAATCVIVY